MTIKELETLKELLRKATEEANKKRQKAFDEHKYFHYNQFYRLWDNCDDALNVLSVYGGYLEQEAE